MNISMEFLMTWGYPLFGGMIGLLALALVLIANRQNNEYQKRNRH